MKHMAGRKRHSAEDIVRKLRRADELAAEGRTGEEIAAGSASADAQCPHASAVETGSWSTSQHRCALECLRGTTMTNAAGTPKWALMTAACQSVLEQLEDFVACNCQTGEDTKPMIALSGLPGLGKSTVSRVFGKRLHRRHIERYGTTTRAGDERWPVCRIGMTASTGTREFNAALCDFYAHPGGQRASAQQLLRFALDDVSSCETRLLIIDDLHFLRGRQERMTDVSNQFKYIANEFPLTVLLIGIGLHEHNTTRYSMTATH